jgi:putative protease
LLSPQDLAAYDLVPELINAGVCSFKIEGRLKTPEYVANIVSHYRRAIDAAMAGRAVNFTSRNVEEMELSFSRGFSHGWLEGCDHKALVPAISSSKRGVLLGHVRGAHKNRVIVELADRAIKRGDGVSFDCGQPVDDEQGGRVYEVFRAGQSLELSFAHGSLQFEQIRAGMRVWKNDDPELSSRLRKTFTAAKPARRTPVDLVVRATEGEPVVIEATLTIGQTCRVASEQASAAAREHSLSEETLREQLGRLGGTPFVLRNLVATIEGRPMLPFSVLGKLRHALVAELERIASAPPTRHISDVRVLPALHHKTALERSSSESTQLHVLCRSLAQEHEALAAGVKSLYVDFQDIREYRQAVELAHAAAATIVLATPRIQKPDEMGIFRALTKHGADGVLVRNLAGLRFFGEQGLPVVADFSLNAANELTTEYLIEQGAVRVTPSYDLNREQLLDLVAAAPASRLEVVVHQHMPMFHMEHCVFCAVLSPGTNKTNCGRPCDRHEVKLRDRLDVEHPLVADVGCRNTLFNAVPQSGAEIVPELLARGVRHFRVELLDERGPQLVQTIDAYRRLLAGEITGKEVWSRLKATNRVGITRGTLEERRHPLAIG